MTVQKQYRVKFIKDGKTRVTTLDNKEIIEFYQTKPYDHIISVKRG